MFLSLPAIIKVLSVFGLILFLTRTKVTLSLSVLIGALTLGFWMNLDLTALLKSALGSLIALQTITLILIVGFILVMSRLMKDTGHLDRIVGSFSSISRDTRITGSVMPALIGLLPMPGGALFSAPMVDTALCKHPMTGEEKTAVNYWFRHIWEYWWPLYPGVVLAVSLLQVDTWRFMLVMAPMTPVTVLAGMVFILKPLGKDHSNDKASFSFTGAKHFLWEITPIFIVILVILALAGMTAFLNLNGFGLKLPGGVSILPGLVAATVWIALMNRATLGQLRSALLDKGILPMLCLIAAIMIFKGIMTDSHAVTQIRNELIAYRIPAALIILIMPFLSGLITGIAIGFVGTSFPLVIPMFHSPDTFTYLLWAFLAYTFGYAGMMLSPVHLCFLVTKDYFKAGLLGSYRYLIFPTASVMLSALMLFVILSNL
jgi:integral membrane protein (TIGR00529 family)